MPDAGRTPSAQTAARLAAIVDSAPTAMLVVNAQGSVVLVNRAAEELFGYARAELLGRPVDALVPPPFAERHPALRDGYFLDPQVRRMGVGRELFGLRKDGSQVPVEIGLNPIETDEGTFVVSAVVDITARQTAEKALRDGETRLRRILETSLDAIVSMDEQGRITGWNGQAEALFGWSRAEAQGRELAGLIIPERQREAHRLGLRRFLDSGAGPVLDRRLELSALRRDGTEFPVEISIAALQLGARHEFSAFVRDIGERQRAEARFRATVESAPTAIVMIDAGGRIVLVNAQTERLFGYGRAELLGRTVEVLVPERFRAQHPELRRQFFASPEPRAMGAGRDLYALRRDGSEFPVEIGLNPIATPEGTFVLSAIVDITARKELDAELRRANERLEARVRERTAELGSRTADLEAAVAALERSNLDLQQFAYVVSHDLQSPLRNISGFVQLLAARHGRDLDPEARDWIRRTVDSTTQMQSLIRDLLSFARVDSRARPFERVELRDVLHDVEGQLESSIRDAGARVTCGELPAVWGDRTQLGQLLQNLVGNALIYHGERPPVVHVSAEERAGAIVVAVRDEGLGIDARHHERIFELFRRLHTQQEFPGTGIGLAICRRVVHRHGGRIWVESEPGRGSTFRFTIPVRTDER